MVFKVGDTVRIIKDLENLAGKYATVSYIFDDGLMSLIDIRDTVERSEELKPHHFGYFRSTSLEPYRPLQEFSIADWDSIMEVLANG